MFMVKLFLKTIGLNQKFITNMPMYHALFNICFTGGGVLPSGVKMLGTCHFEKKIGAIIRCRYMKNRTHH